MEKRAKKTNPFHLTDAKGPSVSYLTGAADTARVALRYVEGIGLDTASTGYAEKVFRMNSIYDPNFTDAGHQPLFYDQWATIYDRYRVTEVEAYFQFVSASGAEGYVVGMIPTHSSSTATGYSDQFEEPHAIFKAIGGVSTPVRALRGKWKLPQLFGLTAMEYSDLSYCADFGSNPADVYFLHLRAQTLDASVGTPVYGILLLTYFVELEHRKDTTSSLLKEFSLFQKTIEGEASKEGKMTLSLNKLKSSFVLK